jgi:hypothetical protein
VKTASLMTLWLLEEILTALWQDEKRKDNAESFYLMKPSAFN